MWEKDRREKGRKNVFYIHTDIVTQKLGEKRAKQFFQNHTNSASKKYWEKLIGNISKKRFFIFRRIP